MLTCVCAAPSEWTLPLSSSSSSLSLSGMLDEVVSSWQVLPWLCVCVRVCVLEGTSDLGCRAWQEQSHRDGDAMTSLSLRLPLLSSPSVTLRQTGADVCGPGGCELTFFFWTDTHWTRMRADIGRTELALRFGVFSLVWRFKMWSSRGLTVTALLLKQNHTLF